MSENIVSSESLQEDMLVNKKKWSWYDYRWIWIAIFAVLIYANSLPNQYAYDDIMSITSNNFVKKGFGGFKEIVTEDYFAGMFGETNGLVAGGRYRPMTLLAYATIYQFWGTDHPMIYHLLNVLSYALLCVIIYVIFKKIFKNYDNEKKFWLSLPFLSALLFTFHPIHTEVVANIKGMDEVWSLLGAVMALLCCILYIETDKRNPLYLIGMVVSFLFGLYSKENAITFFAVIPATMYFFYKPTKKDYIIVMMLLSLCSVAFIAHRYSVCGFNMDVVTTEVLNDPFVNSTKSEEIATTILTWGMYAWLMIFPYHLTCDYYPNFFNIVNFTDGRVLFLMLLVLVLIYFTIKGIKNKSIFAYASIVLMATFSLQSNLLFNIGTFMGERFIFAPSMGILVMFALLFIFIYNKVKNKKGVEFADKLMIGFVVILLGLYAVRTYVRNKDWYSDKTLFIHDLEYSKNSIKINVTAGNTYLGLYDEETDEEKKKELLKKAHECLRVGREKHNANYAAWFGTGNAYLKTREWENAINCYSKAYDINYTHADELHTNSRFVAGQAREDKNDKAAYMALKLMLKMKPEHELNETFKVDLADALSKIGKPDSALVVLNEVIEANPKNATAYNKKGEVYGRVYNNFQESERWIKKSIDVEPSISAYENLGVCYGIQGRYSEAVKAFEKALEINENNPKILGDVINTYAVLGNQAKVKYYQDVLEKYAQKADETSVATEEPEEEIVTVSAER